MRLGHSARASLDVAARRKSLAASSQATRPERGAHSARCGTARDKLRASRARQRPATPLATGARYVGPPRAAGQHSGLPAENVETSFRIGHAARTSLYVAARRKSAGRVAANHKTGARHAKRAMWHRARQVWSAAREAAPHDTAGKGRERRWATAGGRATQRFAGRESGQRFANLAHGTGRKTGARRAKRAMWHRARQV